MIYKYIFLIFTVLMLSGCTSKSINQIFSEKSKKYGVNPKTLKAICIKESSLKPYVINVNKSIFNIQKGSHYFDNKYSANLYMDYTLDPLLLNYDIGICQINKIHLKKNNLDNEELLEPDKNIDLAAKIYLWNVRACKGDIYCALSLYNTGKKKSKTGYEYAKKVLKIRKRL